MANLGGPPASHRGNPLCLASAMERWLQRYGISHGAVFRAISRSGTLERRLGLIGIRRLLRQIKIQAARQQHQSSASRSAALGEHS